LQFVLDKGIQNSLLVGEILEKIRREKEGSDSPPTDPADPTPTHDSPAARDSDDDPLADGCQSLESHELSDHDS
jgi:hypothetical protein